MFYEPKNPNSDAMTERLPTVRCSENLLDLIELAAKAKGVPEGSWIRSTLERAARRILS